MRRCLLVILICSWCLPACCTACRETPAPAAYEAYETPAPYRLHYRWNAGQKVNNFVQIQGGPEFVLVPEFPEEIWRGTQ